MYESLEAQVGEYLRQRRLKLALAESCTGGLVGKSITDVPGSSEYFLGSIVAYAYEAKVTLLGVSWDTLNSQGAVSRETMLQMAIIWLGAKAQRYRSCRRKGESDAAVQWGPRRGICRCDHGRSRPRPGDGDLESGPAEVRFDDRGPPHLPPGQGLGDDRHRPLRSRRPRAVPAGLDGLAYLTTRLTLEIPDEGKARDLMAQATRMTFSCDEDHSLVVIECLSENLEAALRVAGKIIQDPLMTGLRIGRGKDTMALYAQDSRLHIEQHDRVRGRSYCNPEC